MPEVLSLTAHVAPGDVFTAFEVVEISTNSMTGDKSERARLYLTRDETAAQTLANAVGNRICRSVDVVATSVGFYIVHDEHFVPAVDTPLLRRAEEDRAKLVARLTPYERQLLGVKIDV